MSFVLEMIEFIFARKKFWLIPVMLLMVIFGGLIVLTRELTHCTVHLHVILMGRRLLSGTFCLLPVPDK